MGHRCAWAVVVGAGTAQRFGEPKQFALLDGVPVIERAVLACRGFVQGVIVVVPAGRESERFGADVAVAGGPNRSASVGEGVRAVPAEADVIVVHDAARPLASPELFERTLAALDDEGVSAAVCGLPVSDTLKEVDLVGRTVLATVRRETLVAVQTPQAFVASLLREAHEAKLEATDDAALVESLGATVRVVPGDPRNVKLTTPGDLAYAEHLLGG
jgi:2-C-methyl-D-erythritol 4-phosphate cytidylyltransferase